MASSPVARPSLAADPPSLPLLRSQLRQAVSLNSSRQLSHSAKFAAELVAALPAPTAEERRTSRPLAGASSGATVHPHNGGGGGGEQHVHFKTSTPIRGGASGSRTGGAGGGRESLGGLPPIHPGVAQLAAGGVRPQDSHSPNPPTDPASSPAHDRSNIYMADEDDTGDLAAYLATHPSSSSAQLPPPPEPPHRDPRREEWEERDEDEQDLVALAETYFRAHELLRASWVLRDCKGAKARWLRCYSKFLLVLPKPERLTFRLSLSAQAGEKRLTDSLGELLGPSDKTSARGSGNPYTQELLDEMASWEEGEDKGFVEADGGLMYLKALLFLSLPPIAPTPSHSSHLFSHPSSSSTPSTHQHLDLRLVALETLVKSVNLDPWNWSAWLKIAECLDGPEELEATLPFLPPSYPLLLFYVHATLEIHAANDILHDVLDELEAVFPGRNGEGCSVVTGMRALVHYHVREFDESTALFLTLQRTDPYRIDDVDILSNILYVSEKRAELASLAQEYTRVERARPEVCCLVGNYFSLRRDHEKAILYFRRALKLDRGYLSAWTLMGHEYVEIKNTNAAIASYRRAVDVNRKDYRAWYGLGQTYELLGEPFYALDYYQRATALRPYDARMWSALASCYEKLKRIPDAIRSHQRALLASEPGDGTDLCLRIGKLLASLGQTDHAAAYHRRALLEGQRAGWGVGELGGVWAWLVRYEIGREKGRGRGGREGGRGGGGSEADGGDLERAEEYLRAMEASQEFRDEAKALRKEVEVLMLERE
ncbi:hypothetical protein JCM11251_000969 [Rhodosporidiobolus azoricus]